jgi:hypothetical protein
MLVPAWAVRPAVVCSGHCITRTVVPVEGWLQARRERRRVLQVPEVVIEVSANIVAKAESERVIFVRRPPSPRLGAAPPFIGQGGSCLHACHTTLLRVAVWRTVLQS